MTSIPRQLAASLTSSGTWVQLSDEASEDVYTSPSNGRATGNGVRIANHSATNAATVLVAVSEASPSATAYQDYLNVGVSLAAGESLQWTDLFIVPAGQAVWAKATGTTPLVGIRTPVLEVTP